jgi:2-haloacid dehalogenase
MMTREEERMRLSDFSVLSFDCYGTLIDWESGIEAAFRPWLTARGVEVGRNRLLALFGRHEQRQQEMTPGMRYPELLARVHRAVAAELGLAPDAAAAEAFGASVPDWPAFADSPGALAYLKRHYQLVILSNVDRASFARSNQRLGVEFDAVFTAEDIGSYKPDRRNFDYLLSRLEERGIRAEQILHTAESLHHDHVPAKRQGLRTCWIWRRAEEGATASGREGVAVEPDFRFPTLGAMVEAHRAEVAGG